MERKLFGTLAGLMCIAFLGALPPGGWLGAPLSTVEEYDAGFREPQSVNRAGKLATLWGKVKVGK